MYTLGINAVYHDSAAALLRDGVVLAAAEDERFTHVKHAKRPVPFSAWQLPFDAIDTAKLVLTDKLIAATVPLSTEGADEMEEEGQD